MNNYTYYFAATAANTNTSELFAPLVFKGPTTITFNFDNIDVSTYPVFKLNIDWGDGSNRYIKSRVLKSTTISYRTYLSQGNTTQWWQCMTTMPNGNILATTWNGDIYEQYGGTGNFYFTGQATRRWYSITVAPNGDVYATATLSNTGNFYQSNIGGDIYKQTGGTGQFVALTQSAIFLTVAAAPNGNIYATSLGGDIYKQTNGTGDFVALGQTYRNWFGITVAPNNDVYATITDDLSDSNLGNIKTDIYKQSGGNGDFIPLGQTLRNWYVITAAANGDIYATTWKGSIYKQSGGIGEFIPVIPAFPSNPGLTYWKGITIDSSNNIYGCVDNGHIFKILNTAESIDTILDPISYTYYPTTCAYFTSLCAQVQMLFANFTSYTSLLPITIAQTSYFKEYETLDIVDAQFVDNSTNDIFVMLQSNKDTIHNAVLTNL